MREELPEHGGEFRFCDQYAPSAPSWFSGRENEQELRERFKWLVEVFVQRLCIEDESFLLTQEREGVRIDVVDVTASTREKQSGLRLSMIFWGLPLDADFHELRLDLLVGDADGKARLVTIEGEGSPTVLAPAPGEASPTSWVPAWPPSVGAGYYEPLPFLPPGTTRMTLSLNLSANEVGPRPRQLNFRWENVEVRPELWDPSSQKWDVLAKEPIASKEALQKAGFRTGD